jgi:hypothetical protein
MKSFANRFLLADYGRIAVGMTRTTPVRRVLFYAARLPGSIDQGR